MSIFQEMLLMDALIGKNKRREWDEDPFSAYLRMKDFLEKNTKKEEKKHEEEKRKRGKFELSILELSFGLALCMYIGGFVTYWSATHLFTH